MKINVTNLKWKRMETFPNELKRSCRIIPGDLNIFASNCFITLPFSMAKTYLQCTLDAICSAIKQFIQWKNPLEKN